MKKQELLAHSLKRQSNIKFLADQTQCNGDGFTVTIQNEFSKIYEEGVSTLSATVLYMYFKSVQPPFMISQKISTMLTHLHALYIAVSREQKEINKVS